MLAEEQMVGGRESKESPCDVIVSLKVVLLVFLCYFADFFLSLFFFVWILFFYFIYSIKCKTFRTGNIK